VIRNTGDPVAAILLRVGEGEVDSSILCGSAIETVFRDHHAVARPSHR